MSDGRSGLNPVPDAVAGSASLAKVDTKLLEGFGKHIEWRVCCGGVLMRTMEKKKSRGE
jgi:hypothetical protein